ncbi:hypothetical protein FOA43_000054 [Brettanomyces nanus]|uniref:Zn(2)-C6 fungal-type domain-containing protein n=1 Tax=Eeniella nana TaxID=13502 RepID=A0A875RWE7_EENNA|nr:uncharacterized protein FOA43_000054 [Brettanomyces nanus]QPG72753.1 hypothetical protein FOA43_000054 [Brettanomyces nanus]
MTNLKANEIRESTLKPILPNPTHQLQLELEKYQEQVTTRITHEDAGVTEAGQKRISSTTPNESKQSSSRHFEKRSKACTNCRRSKVRCVKLGDDEVCKRCRNQGIQCVYEYKIASYRIVGTGAKADPPCQQRLVHPLAPLSRLPHSSASSTMASISNLLNPSDESPEPPHTSSEPPHTSSEPLNSPKFEWQNSVEERLKNFDSKLGSIITILNDQNSSPHPIRQLPSLNAFMGNALSVATSTSPCISSNVPVTKFGPISRNSSLDLTMISPPNKRRKIEHKDHKSLDDILTRKQAMELFNYFDANISSQLFGFSVGQYSVNSVWETCPLLVATICCISSIHHPVFNNLFTSLEALIHKLSMDTLSSSPKTELEAFNTIMALCFCGFWFQKDQMFTGLALQLARSMNLMSSLNKQSKIPRKDRVKLWFLLYILDGQQSLVFNRQTLVDPRDITLSKGKSILLEAEDFEAGKIEGANKDQQPAQDHSFESTYSNLRLVSQVQYHQAIDCAFEEEAWDLFAPASFGLPYKTNLELDKWMVQWTVLLSSLKACPVWSSKSTLIYYNFAKMHINSTAIRKLQIVGTELPRLDQCEVDDDWNENSKKIETGKGAQLDTNGNPIEENENSEEDENDDSDYNTYQDIIKEMSPYQSRRVSSELAFSAAETVLKIVLEDPNIISALRYVPIHIHIMLYYAALLVLRTPSYLISNREASFEESLRSIRMVKKLRIAVLANTPTDREFAQRLVVALTSILREKVKTLKERISRETDGDRKFKQLEDMLSSNDSMFLKHRKPHKIMAWPGFDSGHPGLDEKRSSITTKPLKDYYNLE